MSAIICGLAFISEYMDSALGMGYGTALAPFLIIMGYDHLAIVPAVLISQFFTDIATCIFHHNFGNVDLRINSEDFKIALVLGLMSALGVFISVALSFLFPKWLIRLYIGLVVLAMGLLVLVTIKRTIRFSWSKIVGLSFLAAFNKGISGGGYGPLVMGGQLLSGVRAHNAVGITAFAEALTCLLGFLSYLFIGGIPDWKLITLLIISAIPAVPFAALTVRKINGDRLKKYVGILISLLGILILAKINAG